MPIKKTISFFLAAVLVLCMSGCKKTPQETSSGVEIIYEYDTEYSSDFVSSTQNTSGTYNNSSESSSDDIYGTGGTDYNPVSPPKYTPPTVIGYSEDIITDIETPVEVQKDFINNLKDYKIIYAKGDNAAMAEKIRVYIFKKFNLSLQKCVDTETEASQREIIIGNTNRSTTPLADNQFKLSFVGKKLYFEGNNVSAVEAAINNLAKKFTGGSTIPTFSGELAEYKRPLTVDGKTFNYVWGDEFEDSSVDFLKSKTWNITHMMGYYSDFDIVPANDVDEFTYAKNGKLVLTAGEYDFTPYIGTKNPTGMTITNKMKYGNGGVLTTSQRMVYRRGYAEIYASVPTNNGSWPAWWTRSTGGNLIRYADGTTDKNPIYTLEVDIFECYDKSGDRIIPNLHKWYKNTVNTHSWEVHGYDGIVVTSKSALARFIGGNEEYQFSTAVSSIPVDRTYVVNSTEDWHKYGFLWTEEKMTFLVDDYPYYTIDLTTDFDGFNDGRYGYNQYMYFLFDNHIYTPNSGDSRCYSPALPDPVFEVDYIRLYQLSGQRDIILNSYF